MRIIPILVVLFISCKNYVCPLNPPESTNTASTSKNWKDPVIDTRGVDYTGAGSASFYYDLLYEREEMLCDLACSVLYIGQDYDEIVRLLGKGNTSSRNIPPGRHIYFNEKSEDNTSTPQCEILWQPNPNLTMPMSAALDDDDSDDDDDLMKD